MNKKHSNKAKIGAVILIAFGAGGLLYYKYLGPQTTVQVSSSRAEEEVETQVSVLLDQAWTAVKKNDYKQAFEICDKAIAQYGSTSILSDTYSNYGEMIKANKEHIKCIQRRAPEKTFHKLEDLKTALAAAIKSADTVQLSLLLHCGMGVGVVGSEYGFEYHPEKLAEELTALRKSKTGELIDFEGSGHEEFMTDGYSDNLTRRFDLTQDAESREWFIGSLLYGSKDEVLETH